VATAARGLPASPSVRSGKGTRATAIALARCWGPDGSVPAVTLVWAVPVVAAAVATILVAAAARPVGDEMTGLVEDVRALRRLREPLARARAATADSEALAAAYRRRHAPADADGLSDERPGGPTAGTNGTPPDQE